MSLLWVHASAFCPEHVNNPPPQRVPRTSVSGQHRADLRPYFCREQARRCIRQHSFMLLSFP